MAGREGWLTKCHLLPVVFILHSLQPQSYVVFGKSDKQITYIITSFPTEHLQHSYLACIGSERKIRWDIGWKDIKKKKNPNKSSYMVTLLDEVIAKHFQVGLGIFRIFNIVKGTIHFLFARRTFLTKEVVVTHFPEMRVWCTHMFTNNLRKRNVVSNAVLSTWGKGLCFFKGSKLVAGSIWKVEETSGKADNRLTSWNVVLTMMTSDRKLMLLIVTLEKDIKLQSKTDLTAIGLEFSFILKSLRFKNVIFRSFNSYQIFLSTFFHREYLKKNICTFAY